MAVDGDYSGLFQGGYQEFRLLAHLVFELFKRAHFGAGSRDLPRTT